MGSSPSTLQIVKVGDRVFVKTHEDWGEGIVRYKGPVPEINPNKLYVGIELNKPRGKHNGTIEGKKYFECSNNHGIFANVDLIKVVEKGETGTPQVSGQEKEEKKKDNNKKGKKEKEKKIDKDGSIFETPISKVIPKQQKLIRINSSTTIPKAFSVLIEHNIYSAPVWNEKENKYVGFLDLVDIVTFVHDIFSETEILGEEFDLFTIDTKQKIFSQEYAGKVTDLSNRNPFHPIDRDKNLKEALKIFSETKVHRLPVSKGGKVENVLTESAVLSFFESHLEQLGSIIHMTLKELELDKKDVLSIKSTDKAIEAFKLMAKHKISAVAVVDENGQLLSSITAKDLRVENPIGCVVSILFLAH